MASACDIVVIGGSAGGVESVVRLVQALPADLPAAIFIVVHFPPHSTSYLPQILSRQRTLPAIHPSQRQAIEPGYIYVAPPDYHLIIREDRIELSHSPRVNGHRPAIDPLFFSAARACGPRVVSVILSGLQDDGVAGLHAVKAAGGTCIVQDPDDALFAAMPRNAIDNVPVDYVLPLDKIAQTIAHLARKPAGTAPGMPAASGDQEMEVPMDPEQEHEFVQQDIARFEQGKGGAGRSTLTCPECGGVLWELGEGELTSYRCHVGHVFSAESMLSEQAEQLESALWVAVRTLEERATLLRRMAASAAMRNSKTSQKRFRSLAEDAEASAGLIRDRLLNGRNYNPGSILPPNSERPPRGDRPAADD